MAFNQRVGRAVLELTADSATYDASIAHAKTDAKELGQTWQGTQRQLQGLSSSLQAHAARIASITKDFSGDRAIQQAHQMVAAVQQIGGVTKLTEAEQGRVNRTVADAIAKYAALGHTAPQAMLDLERATRRVEQAQKSLGQSGNAVFRDIDRLSKSFLGREVIGEASRMVAAIQQIGGVTRLTTTEKSRLNSTLSQAIEKYRALGQQAPKAMLDLELATRKVEPPTNVLTTRMIALGAAAGAFIGTLASQLALRAGRTLVQIGKDAFTSAGQIIDLKSKTGESVASLQRMQFVADQTGTSLDTMANAAFMLRTRLAGGGDSVVQALRDLQQASGIAGLTTRSSADDILTALSQVSDSQERVRLGNRLFGRSYRDLAAGVTEGYADIAKGAKLSSDEQLAALDRAGDRWAAFVRNTKAQIQSFLGDILLQRDAMRQLREEMPGVSGDATGYGDENYATGDRKRLIEMQRRLQLGLVGGRQTDITLRDPAARSADEYRQRLAEVHRELAKLTSAQRAEIAAALELGESTDDLENAYDLTAGALRILSADTKAYESNVKQSTEAQREATEAQQAWHASYRDLTSTFSRWIQVGQDANVVALDTMRLYTAMPPAIISAAEALEGRLIPAQYGLAAAFEASARAKAQHDKLLQEGMVTPDFGITSEDVTGEARQIGQNAIAQRLAEQRAQIVEFWKRQATQLESATIGRLGTLFFGNLGKDINGQLKATADEAHQDFLRIQRSGKATAEELTLAMRRWREAESRANVGFGERWKQFWGGIQQTFVSMLDDMLQYYLKTFVGGLIRGLTSGKIGQALGNALSGGVAGATLGGGAAAATAATTGGVLASSSLPVASLMGGGAAAGGTAAAGTTAAAGGGAAGGSFLANPAFWTNPWTIGAAAGIAVGLAVWKKGLFRGGEEGVKVNPRRDKFQLQFGGATAAAAGARLAALLTRLTGEEGGGRLFHALQAADSVKEFEAAQAAIIARLAQAGQRNVRAFNSGTRRLDFEDFGARTPVDLHHEEAVIPRGGGHRLAAEIATALRTRLQVVMPTFSPIVVPMMPAPVMASGRDLALPSDRAKSPSPAATARPVVMNNYYTIEGVIDSGNFEELTRKYGFRELKRAMFFNTDDMGTAVAKAGSR